MTESTIRNEVCNCDNPNYTETLVEIETGELVFGCLLCGGIPE